MQRAQLRLIVVVLAVVSLGWVGYRVSRVLNARRQDDVGSALRLLPDAVQRLQDFQRVKLEDGRVVWELSAREAQYFEDGHRAVIKGPEMTFYTDGVKEGRLAAEEGSVIFDGADLRTVEMRVGVRVEGSGYVVETESATYERERDRIVAPGAVRIVGRNMTVRGSEMEIAVSEQKMTLRRDVRVTFSNANGHDS
jgi:LPS export ABC transporter protein LptC